MKLAPCLAVLALLAVGCGDEPVARQATTPRPLTQTEPPNTNTALSPKEASVIGVAVTAADRVCRDDGGPEIPVGRLRALVNDLIRLAERKPDDIGSAFGEPKNTPRNGLEQVLAKLEESSCAPAVQETVRDALASL